MLSTDGQVPVLVRPESNETGITAKRLLDIIFALGGLVCFVPLMAFVAVAIYIDSGRPIFFSQIRLGRRGQHFHLYKFRKFHENAKDEVSGRAVTLKNDSRFTRVGRFLAQTKLDELPQLWNVLKGEMSIVGPRPETPNFADCFRDTYQRVLEFKPGIFGPNQVFFRNESLLHEVSCDPEQLYRDVLFPLKARVDLAYFPYANVFMDIFWIARGVFAVFGWSFSCRQGSDLIADVDDWIRQSRQRDSGACASDIRRRLRVALRDAPRALLSLRVGAARDPDRRRETR